MTAKPAYTLPADHCLIGLTGRAGSGKDTAAEYLVDEFGFVATSFAAPIKAMLEAMFNEAGADHAYLYEPALKNEVIPELGVSARQLMQTLGDWGRAQHPLWWVFLLARSTGLHDLPHSTPVHDRIVVTDLRYPDEAAWITQMGGQCIRLHREGAAPVREHSSEQHFDALPVMVDLVNNGPTTTSLHALIAGAMAGLGIQERASLAGPYPASFL